MALRKIISTSLLFLGVSLSLAFGQAGPNGALSGPGDTTQNPISPGTPIPGCTSKILTTDSNSLLACVTALSFPFSTTDATASTTSATGSFVAAGGIGVGGAINVGTTVGILDTSAAFYVNIGATSSVALTANRALTLNMENVAHILTLGTTANTGNGIIFPNTATDTVAMLGIANTFTANQTVSSASLITSGAISATAWTTTGLRIKASAASYTDTSSSGTVAAAYSDLYDATTILASSATTYTNYYGAYFVAPVASTNVTMTNKWALGADSINVNGQVQANAYGSSGTLPTLTGSCAVVAGTRSGGATAGSFAVPAGNCATTTTVIASMPTAPHGWACDAHDLTTPTSIWDQTATGASSITFTIRSVNAAAADVITFKCMGY